MKNIYKKIIIMFVMVLGIMGIGAISNGYVANAATVGDQLLQPEDGWKRYDDKDSKILRFGTFIDEPRSTFYKGTESYSETIGSSYKFEFYGSKIRLYGCKWTNRTNADHIEIFIDGNSVGKINTHGDPVDQMLLFDYNTNKYSTHTVEIVNIALDGKYLMLDAVDIDEDGYLIEPALELSKSSLKLQEGSSKDLIATTTPSSVNVVWSSSDETIAIVNQTGEVTGIKEGTCTVTATIEGTDIKADCIVTVTKEDAPVEPDDPTGDGNLFIEMVDGNIKQGQDLDVDNFIKWFKNRDLDKTENPIYKIKNAKGNVEYLVHDKVVGFEIR